MQMTPGHQLRVCTAKSCKFVIDSSCFNFKCHFWLKYESSQYCFVQWTVISSESGEEHDYRHDIFISCLDSHSDGTHSLQRIHWWASDVKSHEKMYYEVAISYEFVLCNLKYGNVSMKPKNKSDHQWGIIRYINTQMNLTNNSYSFYSPKSKIVINCHESVLHWCIIWLFKV